MPDHKQDDEETCKPGRGENRIERSPENLSPGMVRPVVLYDLTDDFCVLCSQFCLASFCTLGIFRRYPHDAFGAGKDLCSR